MAGPATKAQGRGKHRPLEGAGSENGWSGPRAALSSESRRNPKCLILLSPQVVQVVSGGYLPLACLERNFPFL